MTEPEDRLIPGTRVDRWVVEDLLGQGAYAAVYRARHVDLGTACALKVLTAPSRSLRARFQREARVQAGLAHPNVARVTDVVEADGTPAIVMELVEGPSLEKLLSERRLSLAECDALFPAIVAGVAAAHAAGLVHRDLKPANILLSPASKGWVPKVSDFGLVKLLDDGPAPTTRTRSGAFLGTPAYTAPEQMRDASRVDARADVFSLGAIAFEMTTGKRAFPQEDFIDVLQASRTNAFPRPRAERPDLPARMEQAIAGALVGDREARIASCEDLLAVWEGRTARPVARSLRPWALGGGVAVLALALTGVGLSSWPVRSPPAGAALPLPLPSAAPSPPRSAVPTPALATAPTDPAPPSPVRQKPAPAGPISLLVTSRPVALARVMVDGQPGERLGRNVWKFPVMAGSHRVELVGTDGRSARAAVTAASDTSWCWDFETAGPCGP